MKNNSSKNPQFSAEEMRKVLGSAEGRQLIALLSRDSGALRQAAEAFKSGDAATAQKLLQPLVNTPEASELLQKINEK